MRILFVYENMTAWGGIETYLVRTLPRLASMGHQVSLLTGPRGEVPDGISAPLDQVSDVAQIFFTAYRWPRPTRRLRALRLAPVDVVIPCDLNALLLTAMVHRQLLSGVPVVVAVFHPREYCWRPALLRRPWLRHLSARIVRQLPLENLLFATDATVRETGECAGRDLRGAPVVPLPIEVQPAPRPRRDPIERSKIVSVARLAPYYVHHHSMIEVIRELRDGGCEFSYHVYGEGEERQALESEARRLDVADRVFLHGAISYEHFSQAVGDAFVYVGPGTAMLEAAACGVPALVPIDSVRDPVCYGFLQDTASNDLGGYVPGQQTYDIAERIQWLASLSNDEYWAIGEASRLRAAEFGASLVMPRLIRSLEAAQPVSLRVSMLDRYLALAEASISTILWRLGFDAKPSARHSRLPPLSTVP